jgi:extracellular factor (EF) 3-hydroxypalmitic acid methyl ester biosynthesis protein
MNSEVMTPAALLKANAEQLQLQALIQIETIADEDSAWKFLQVFDNVVAYLETRYSKDYILTLLMPLRNKVSDAWLLHRAQRWPRGYAGDFETIDYLIQGRQQTSAMAFGYALESVFLKSPIVQQHRNKIRHQAETISKVLRGKGAAHILSVGCGTCEDFYSVAGVLQHSNASVTLVDIDADALAYSRKRLSPFCDRLTTLRANIHRIAHKLPDTYDLILVGGVFDYCTDRYIVSVLSRLFEAMRPGGVIFFTNIARDNPYRRVMEYLTDWTLIERSDVQLRTLVEQAGWSDGALQMSLDDTRLTWLVSLSK